MWLGRRLILLSEDHSECKNLPISSDNRLLMLITLGTLQKDTLKLWLIHGIKSTNTLELVKKQLRTTSEGNNLFINSPKKAVIKCQMSA